jgi:hypothetical protein
MDLVHDGDVIPPVVPGVSASVFPQTDISDTIPVDGGALFIVDNTVSSGVVIGYP